MWIEYKKEKRDAYKTTGLKSLVTIIKGKVGKYGEDAIVQLITECMSNGWKGIIWERLKEPERPFEYDPGDWEGRSL